MYCSSPVPLYLHSCFNSLYSFLPMFNTKSAALIFFSVAVFFPCFTTGRLTSIALSFACLLPLVESCLALSILAGHHKGHTFNDICNFIRLLSWFYWLLWLKCFLPPPRLSSYLVCMIYYAWGLYSTWDIYSFVNKIFSVWMKRVHTSGYGHFFDDPTARV